MKSALVLFVLLASAAVAHGQALSAVADRSAPVRLPRFERPPAIDGRLDDDAWTHAVVLGEFVQIRPGDNAPPSKPTEVLIGYDSTALYVAFRAADEQAGVQATVARRDAIFDDDYVGFYLDTFNDQRRAFEMFFNPLGIQADGIITENRGEDFSVDVVMESKGVVTADGYTVEVAIPFKSLRYEAGKDRLWGAHFFRRIQRFDHELDSWMPFERNNSATLGQAGHLTGLEDIPTEHNLEITPSLTFSETGRRVPGAFVGQLVADPLLVDRGRFVNKPLAVDPGLTLKYGITPTVTFDLAINPDFAQVEADATVVTANQRFPIFFDEKRPFFLEGIDYFQTPLSPVHTRTIVDPDLAVKLTGKRGRTTFGLLLASDNAPGNFSDEERDDPTVRQQIERLLDRNASIGVLRLKRDFGVENTLGLVATSYDFVDQHNKVAGVDGRFRLDEKTTAEFQLLGTASRRYIFDPLAGQYVYGTGNGLGYEADYNVAGRHFGYELYGEGRTSNYYADVGFTSRVNTNFNSTLVRYNSEPKPKASLISWHVHNFSHIDYDFQGRMQIWESEFAAEWTFKHQTVFGLAYEKAWERVFEEEFGPVRTATRPGAFTGPDNERSSSKNHYFVSGSTRPTKYFSMNFRAVVRDGHFDYDFGAGPEFPRVSPAALADPNAPYDPGPGKLFQFTGGVAFQPTDALRTTLNFTKDRLRRYDTGLVAFDDNIFSSKTTYQFTSFLYARARIDYSTLSSRARGQFLLGWTPNPGTAFFVGYNDDLTRTGFNPFSGELEPGLRRNGRTFFVKMSYLIRRSI